MSLTLAPINVAGFTKKEHNGAAVFVAYCLDSVMAVQTFRTDEASLYHSAYIAILIGYGVKTALACVLNFYMWSVNKK